ncbi:MAG: DUF4270 family protein [bacterium]|nr:DUF4270 family protein [bacterium]
MWRRGLFLSATFLLMVAVSVGCKKKNFELGQDVISGEDQITSGSIDTFSIYTSSFRTDSVISSNRFFGILGSCNDPEFGTVNSEIYTQFRIINLAPTFDLPNITIDSVVLSMVYSGVYGSPGDQTIEVFQIDDTKEFSDTTDYYPFDEFQTTGTNLVVPGTETMYLDPNAVTYVDTTLVQSQLRIQLDTNFAWQLFNEANNNPASFADNDGFTEYFQGLKIRTNNGYQAPGEGGLFYFNLNEADSKIRIYYKSEGENRIYDLVINDVCADFNHIDFVEDMDVTSVINNPSLGQQTYYAQSFQSRGLVKIPGLDNIPSNAIVHSATLELPVQYQTGRPFEPGTELSVSLFTSSTDSTLVSDGSTIGLYSSGNKTFVINMRNYVQRIVSGEIENNGFIVSPLFFSNTMDRIVFNGPDTDKKLKPTFKITFSEF